MTSEANSAPLHIAASQVTADGASPTRQLVMLHGIYGRGRNWQSIARTLVARRPDYRCWLVDLPFHGGSSPSTHGGGVLGLAADVDEWLAREVIEPDALLGHSYGGKVALALASRRPEPALQVWVIDSTPEAKPPSGSAWDMLQIVRTLPRRVGTRAEVVDAIVRGGFPLGVAQWMSTNLEREGDGFVWSLDFDAMERLLHAFFETDLWPVVEGNAIRHDLHFLKASASSAMSPSAVARVEGAASDHVHLHHAEGGHWIHAESPETVLGLLVDHLP